MKGKRFFLGIFENIFVAYLKKGKEQIFKSYLEHDYLYIFLLFYMKNR